MSLAEQFMAFLITIGVGAAAAFIYDLYRAIRTALGLRRLASSVGDLFFWLFLTAVVFAMLLFGVSGDVRWSVLFGMVMGAFLYRRILSDRGYRFWIGLGRALRPVRRAVGYPFVLLWVVAIGPFRVPVRLLRGIKRRFARRGPPPEQS